MKVSFAAAAALMVVSFPLAAAPAAALPPEAKGRFESKGLSFEVFGVYAYRTTSGLGKEKVVNVVVSNAGIDASYFDAWLDRGKAFEKKFQDDETAVVNFEFSPDGRFVGVRYDFGSSNYCGFSYEPGMKSTVKLVEGRLRGDLAYRGEKSAWDVSFDVAIASDDHGVALPAGGGEPGDVFLAYSTALKAGDAAALKKILTPPGAEAIARLEKEGSAAKALASMNEDRRLDSVSVQGGVATSDQAVLLFKATSRTRELKGEAILTKGAQGWNLVAEYLD